MEFLKGNFKLKKEIIDPDRAEKYRNSNDIGSELRKRALASLGGSMVYVERTDLTWDGNDDKQS